MSLPLINRFSQWDQISGEKIKDAKTFLGDGWLLAKPQPRLPPVCPRIPYDMVGRVSWYKEMPLRRKPSPTGLIRECVIIIALVLLLVFMRGGYGT